MNPTLLVMAAGVGSRYGSLKQVDKFGPSGETIVEYSVYDAVQAGFGKVVFVIRENMKEEFEEILFKKFSHKIAVDYVFQELDNLPEGIQVPEGRQKPWGTGHAVMVAADKVHEPFAVINADDYYGAQTFRIMAEHLNVMRDNAKKNYCMVGYQLENTLSEHGYVSRGICQVDEQDYLQTVIERTHISYVEKGKAVYHDEQGNEVVLSGNEIASMNLMGFTPSVFPYFKQYFEQFIQRNRDLKTEFFLPTVVNNLIQEDIANVKVLHTPEKWFGVTYQEDKNLAIEKLSELVRQGVYPEKLWAH